MKYIKTKIQQIRLKCAQIRHQLKYQRAFVVCRLIHVVFVSVAKVGAVPFTVTELEDGYRQLIPVGRKRKRVINAVHIYLILGAVFYTLLPLSSKFKVAVGGKLTADCLLWALSTALSAMPAIMGFKLLTQHKEFALVYSSAMMLIRSATRKHLKGQHIFCVAKIHGSVVCLLVCACAATFLCPVVATLIWAPLRHTPEMISYHIAGPYADIRGDDTFQIFLYWAGAFFHWMYCNYVGFLCNVLMVGLGEAFVASTMALKMIRSLEPTEISWREKLKFHGQVELMTAAFNELVGFVAPVVLLVAFMLSVCTIIGLMMIDLDAGFPSSVALIPVAVVIGVGAVTSGFIVLKFAEEFRANSIAYLEDVEAEITAFVRLKYRHGKMRHCFATGRTFRRRPVGFRLWYFMWVDEGMSVSYLMQTADKAMNYFFMVDLRSNPIWLWGRP